ncbi:hypothetical protein HZS_2789, partial [Henneguya salminicola]
TEQLKIYYYDAFNILIDEVKKCPEDFEILFNSEKIHLLVKKFYNLEYIHKKILFRIYFRKKEIIEVNKIQNIEKKDLEIALKRLEIDGFIQNCGWNTKDEVLNMLNKKSIDMLIKEFKIPCKSKTIIEKKHTIARHVLSYRTINSYFQNNKIENSRHPIIEKSVEFFYIIRAISMIGECIKISVLATEFLNNTFFYLNIKTDLINSQANRNNLKISDLGQNILLGLNQLHNNLIKFPHFIWTPKSILNYFYKDSQNYFQHINIFPKYLKILNSTRRKEMLEISHYFEEFYSLLQKIILEISIEFQFDLFHLSIIKSCSKLSDAQEINKQPNNSILLLNLLLKQNYYSSNYRGHWYNRLTIIYSKKCKNFDKVMDILNCAISDEKALEHFKYVICKRCLKTLTNINKSHELSTKARAFIDGIYNPPTLTISAKRINIDTKITHSKFQITDFIFDQDNVIKKISTISNVENYALNYYSNKFKFERGLFAEGAPFLTLYGLFLWDITYTDIQNVFFTQYQIKPSDYYTSKFYFERENLIIDRFNVLKDSNYDNIFCIFRKNWETNYGSLSPCVNWEIFSDLEDIFNLIKCIDRNVLLGIFKRFLENITAYRSGFPDLLLWSPDNLSYKIVEVKGPGDRPSSKQIIWFDYLLKIGANVEICYVKDAKN